MLADAKSCAEWYDLGFWQNDTTEADIKPTETDGPFKVECDLNSMNGTAVTTIGK